MQENTAPCRFFHEPARCGIFLMEVSGHDGAGNFALEARVEASAAGISSSLAEVPEVRCKVG
jgi:hypothetical protein